MSDHPQSPLQPAALDPDALNLAFDGQFAKCCSIGIRFDRLAAEARGCLLGISESPLHSSPEILAVQTETLTSDLLRGLVEIEQDSTELTSRELLHSELTVIAIRIAERLFADAINSRFIDETDSILAIGIHGDGIWNCETDVRCYHEMVDVSRIAEHFGRTVVSGFPERDVAQGGSGGPVESHGVWLLLADRNEPGSTFGCHWRGLIDINSHATQFSMIGPIDRHLRSQALQACDLCVGDRLLTEIAAHLSEAEHGANDMAKPSDLLGSIEETARAGTPIPELCEIWDSVATRNGSWSPSGVSPLPLVYALRNSIYGTSAAADLLATASHFIGTQIAKHIRYGIPAATPIGELFVIGNAGKSQQVLDALPDQIPGVRIRSLADLGQDRTLYAAGVAALALLHLWQVPLPSTKVGEVPRLLGRITPGNPSNWRRVLSLMNSNAPWLLPLREAI